MKRSDWILLALDFADGDSLAPVHLQKCLFLLGEYFKREVKPGFYRFIPYSYGPFCPVVYDDARELAFAGYVSIHPSPTGRWSEYTITGAGRERSRRLQEEAHPDACAYLRGVVKWAKKQSFEDLVKAIYKEFPSYKERSVFRD